MSLTVNNFNSSIALIPLSILNHQNYTTQKKSIVKNLKILLFYNDLQNYTKYNSWKKKISDLFSYQNLNLVLIIKQSHLLKKLKKKKNENVSDLLIKRREEGILRDNSNFNGESHTFTILIFVLLALSLFIIFAFITRYIYRKIKYRRSEERLRVDTATWAWNMNDATFSRNEKTRLSVDLEKQENRLLQALKLKKFSKKNLNKGEKTSKDSSSNSYSKFSSINSNRTNKRSVKSYRSSKRKSNFSEFSFKGSFQSSFNTIPSKVFSIKMNEKKNYKNFAQPVSISSSKNTKTSLVDNFFEDPEFNETLPDNAENDFTVRDEVWLPKKEPIDDEEEIDDEDEFYYHSDYKIIKNLKTTPDVDLSDEDGEEEVENSLDLDTLSYFQNENFLNSRSFDQISTSSGQSLKNNNYFDYDLENSYQLDC
ncbi:hypothetical protein HDU92_001937 [Lobulomyces angularis]|nr:hypothetical protein HDU92_001937 [Lobulomyces angularis]